MYKHSFSVRFQKQYQKLDPHIKELVKKKIAKIMENPLSGKPLHTPLQNLFSERIEKLRIVYSVQNDIVGFEWIEHRNHVYH